jgi:hypothetical protein
MNGKGKLVFALMTKASIALRKASQGRSSPNRKRNYPLAWVPKKPNHVVDEGQKEIRRLVGEVGKHRCRLQTGNWCLDCEIKHAKAQGIQFVLSMMEESEKNEEDISVRSEENRKV